MFATDLPHARRLAFSVVLGQATVTLLTAILALSAADHLSAISALLGGGIGTAASLAMAAMSFGAASGTDAQRVLRAFYLGEAAKLGLTIVLFAVVLKRVKVVPLALFAGYGATFLVYWLGLGSALPRLVGRTPRAARGN